MSAKNLCPIVLALVITSCATSPQKRAPNAANQGRVQELRKQIESKEQQIRKLRDENIALQGVAPDKGRPRPVLALRGAGVVAVPGLSPTRYETMAEKQLYAEIVKSAQIGDADVMGMALPAYLRRFPKSIYADDVAYLAGEFELSRDRLGEAIQAFNLVINGYPLSNKRKEALFDKARAFKRMNLRQQALNSFELVAEQYPGSAESKKAAIEIELLKAEAHSNIN